MALHILLGPCFVKKACNYSKKTRDLLNTAIAIPILVGKKISLYEKISKEISFLQDGK